MDCSSKVWGIVKRLRVSKWPTCGELAFSFLRVFIHIKKTNFDVAPPIKCWQGLLEQERKREREIEKDRVHS